MIIVRCAKNPQLYFARRLNAAMKGLGTDEDTLIRIIIGRSEVGVCLPPPPFDDGMGWGDAFSVVINPQIDLETVKDMYLEKYDVTLKDALDSECGGDFKRLLIEILH